MCRVTFWDKKFSPHSWYLHKWSQYLFSLILHHRLCNEQIITIRVICINLLWATKYLLRTLKNCYGLYIKITVHEILMTNWPIHQWICDMTQSVLSILFTLNWCDYTVYIYLLLSFNSFIHHLHKTSLHC